MLLDKPSAASPKDANLSARRGALMIYTSGTTSRPKGVVWTHEGIESQIQRLIQSWGWSCSDRILQFLPLHHVHGLINILHCALWAGARCELLPRFDPEEVWRRIETTDLTLLMAVPTVYQRLIQSWEAAEPERRRTLSGACGKLRLMVSGSAALPVESLRRWREISGHTLLERYGMSEIGMALSNPLHGDRRPGFVGTPLPGVEVRLVDDAGQPCAPGVPGEIEVRGKGLFREYWCRPEQTRRAFRHGWFKTGDIAVVEQGAFRILGRRSVDIIKRGGHKLSALEIEDVLRRHPAILDCAVVGSPDLDWGESVCAAIVLQEGASLNTDDLRDWAREQMAPYKIPTAVTFLSDLPRNAMGKVTKAAVKTLFDPSSRPAPRMDGLPS